MYGIVICKSFYFTKSLLINDIFLRYKCPVKSFAFFLLAFINFWVWVFVYTLRKRYCAMLFHSYIHVTWLLCCQISGSKNTFFKLSVFKPLQGSQAAQAGSTVACLDRASIRYQNECGSVNEARRKCKKARFVLFFLLKLTSLTFKNSREVILKQVYVYCENI